MRVLLASASPRRRQLLGQLLGDFAVTNPEADENYTGETPQKTVTEIAKRKLKSVKNGNEFDIIIACDTMVFLDNTPIGKPKDAQDAFRILGLLNGKTHTVITALAVRIKGKEVYETVTSTVSFKSLTDAQLVEYINTHDVLDKAGAYGIQDKVLVDNYQGSYTNIVGLPIEKLKEIIFQR